MHAILAQILGYVRGVWRYRWVALVVAWAVASAGWVVVSKLPDRFEASARVFVDTNSVLRPLLSGLAVQPDLMQRVALMSKMLLNRPTLDKVVRMSDLDLGVTSEDDKERLLTELSENISLRGDLSNPSLYSVTFEHPDPASAKRVVQSLVNIFIEEALVSDQRESATAQKFLDEEISDYERRLREAEERLADFKRRHMGIMPGDEGGYYERLQAEKGGLAEAELLLREAIQRRDEFKYQLDAEQSVYSLPVDAGLTEVQDPRIQELQSELDKLLLHYTERHPDVISIRRLISELRAENAREGRQQYSRQQANIQANPAYGDMRFALSEAEAQVAAMRARVEDYERRVQDLEAKIDSIPTIEAELKQLTRDYTTLSEQHAELLERRESARLSEQVEKTTEGVKFRVIDPPYVPPEPSAPNRALLGALVLLVGVGAGLGLALALDLLRPVFDDRRALYRTSGLPVLGTVTLVRSPSAVRKDRLALIPFLALSFGLVVAFVLITIRPQGLL